MPTSTPPKSTSGVSSERYGNLPMPPMRTVVDSPPSSVHSAFTPYAHASRGSNDTSKLAAHPGSTSADAGEMPNGASSVQRMRTGTSPVLRTLTGRDTRSLMGMYPKSSERATSMCVTGV